MWPNPQETADLATFAKEIFNGKLHFLRSECSSLTSGKIKCNNHYTQQLFLKQQYCKLYFDFQLRHVYIVNLLKQENVYLKRTQKGKHNLKLNNPYISLTWSRWRRFNAEEKDHHYCIAQKMKFSTKDFFSKCDQIRSFLRHLLKKSLIKNFAFWAVLVCYGENILQRSRLEIRFYILFNHSTIP